MGDGVEDQGAEEALWGQEKMASRPFWKPESRASGSPFSAQSVPWWGGFPPTDAGSGHTNATTDAPACLLRTGRGFALQHNRIQDVALLGRCASLRFLTLAHNFLSDVSPLASLPNLLFLDVSYNTLADVEQLVGTYIRGGQCPRNSRKEEASRFTRARRWGGRRVCRCSVATLRLMPML